MEWLAVSIGIGLLVSFLFTELFGLSVGGMIVPGYLALSLENPIDIGLTLLAALATWAAIDLVDRWAILFGRRRVVLTLLMGFAIGLALRFVLDWPTAWTNPDNGAPWLANATVIGFVIPGLIALWIHRAGMLQTISPLIVSSCLVRLVLVVLGMESLG